MTDVLMEAVETTCPSTRPATSHTFFRFPRSIGPLRSFRDGTDRWFSGLRKPGSAATAEEFGGGTP